MGRTKEPVGKKCIFAAYRDRYKQRFGAVAL